MHTPPPDADATARRAARAAWPVRIVALEDGSESAMSGTVEQRLTAVWELTLQAWAVAGSKDLDDVRRLEQDRDRPR